MPAIKATDVHVTCIPNPSPRARDLLIQLAMVLIAIRLAIYRKVAAAR